MTNEELKAKLDEIMKKDRAAASSGNILRPYDIPDGQSRFRILPGWRSNGDPTFWHMFGQHFVKSLSADAEGKDTVAVHVCPLRTFRQSCPTCRALYAIEKSGRLTPALEKKISSSRAQQRYLVNVLHRNGPDPLQPVVLSLPKTVWEQIAGDGKGNGGLVGVYGYPIDLKDGYDIILTRSGTGFTTRYRVDYAPNSQPVPEAVLKNLNDLDAWVASHTTGEEVAQRGLNALAQIAGALPALPVGAPTAGVIPPAPSGYVHPTSPTPNSLPWDAPAPVAATAATVAPAIDNEAVAKAASSMPKDELEALLATL